MLALYELLGSLPTGFVPPFAPRHNKLCLFLLGEEKMDEEETMMKYFKDRTRKKYFNNLKNELKKVLTRYFIAYPPVSDDGRRAIYEECYQNFTYYKTYLGRGKRNVAIEIAQELLPKLVDTELFSLAHIVSHDLYFHYSTIDYSRGLAQKYKKLAEVNFEIIKAESLVRMYHSRIGYICNSRDSYPPNIVAEFVEAVEHTLPLLRLGYHQINRLIYTILVSRYIVVYDYEKIISSCDKALVSFPKNHLNKRSLDFAFIHKKIPSLIALGRLDEAKEKAREISQMMPVGNFNWKIALLKRIIVCFHASDYQEAYELFKSYQKQTKQKKKSTQQKSEKNTSKTMFEFWNIIQGYLYFLIHRGKITPYDNERFYLGKFLNEMPIYSRDKAGHNINILIVQILIWMQKEKYGHIIDHIESLREYARRYTRNPETKRANIFINMIVKMNNAKFHRSHTELKTQKLFDKLKATPLKLGQNLAVEIIPYPVLWEEILNTLENKFRAVTIRKTSKSKKA